MSRRGSVVKRRMKTALFQGRTWAPCCFCRRPLSLTTATLEHVTPLSRGGGWTKENLRLSCGSCNHRRGTEDFEAYRSRVRQFREAATSGPPPAG